MSGSARPSSATASVVIGLGVIGLLAAQILRAHGCRVFGIDLDPATLRPGARARRRRGHGAAGRRGGRVATGAAASAPISWSSPRRRTGSDPAVLAAEVARDKGRIVAVGATGLDLPRRTLYQKELSLVVSRSYGPGRYDPDYEERGHDYPRAYVRWTERENMRAFLELVADGRVDVRPLVSHRFDIERGAEAYDALEKGDALGILIDYGDAPAAAGRRLRRRAVSRPRASRRRAAPGSASSARAPSPRSVLLPSLTPRRRDAGAASSPRPVCPRDRRPTSSASRLARPSADDVWRDGDCDAVVIATRHDSHARLTIDALEAGKAVFVEKPLCITEDELDRIAHVVDTLRAAGQAPFVMVGFNRRFAPAVEAVRSGDGRRAGEHRLPRERRPPRRPELDRACRGGRRPHRRRGVSLRRSLRASGRLADRRGVRHSVRRRAPTT